MRHQDPLTVVLDMAADAGVSLNEDQASGLVFYAHTMGITLSDTFRSFMAMVDMPMPQRTQKVNWKVEGF